MLAVDLPYAARVSSLIGGTITLIGTSPNLLVSTVRPEDGGRAVPAFKLCLVGLPLAVLAVAFLGRGLAASAEGPQRQASSSI
jgi:Na+/H+ antiporter NhaD/arsenite permease-like protein